MGGNHPRHDGVALLEKRGRGQPTKLTSGRHQRIVANVAASGRIGLAARAAGVAQSTASAWIGRGISYAEHLQNGGSPIENEVRYLNFALDIAKAEAMYELSVVGHIRAVGAPHETSVIKIVERIDAEGNTSITTETTTRKEDDWRALAWLLEKHYPDRYSPLQRTEHTGRDGGPMEVETVGIQIDLVEERDARIEEILGALADSRGGPRAAAIALARGSTVPGEVVDAASHEIHAPHTNGSTNGVSPP
jgi:hypothetical protein